MTQTVKINGLFSLARLTSQALWWELSVFMVTLKQNEGDILRGVKSNFYWVMLEWIGKIKYKRLNVVYQYSVTTRSDTQST